MLAQAPSFFDGTDWTTLVIPGVGILVTTLVALLVILFGRWRRKRRGEGSREEDLSWEDLLELLRRRRRDRQEVDLGDDDVPPEQMLDHLLAWLPGLSQRAPESTPEDHEFKLLPGNEQRSGRRRW